MNKYKIGLPP